MSASRPTPAEERAPATRMPRAQRRSEILVAAGTEFARGGYAGTTTDAVARAAGVSQPYVVRMFGGKNKLFLAVLDDAVTRIAAAFATRFDALEADGAIDPATGEVTEDAWLQLGDAYLSLVTDRHYPLVLMQGFVAAADPQIGDAARAAMGRIHTLVAERTGAPDEQVRDFIAHGMLINVLVAIDAPAHQGAHPGLDALTSCIGLTDDPAAP